MCGIVGAAGDLTPKVIDAFKDLLVMDSLRGVHSTGMISVSWNKDVDIFKRAMNPFDFLSMKQTDNLLTGRKVALIGHNRYATKGKINHINAHPFEHEHICGVHNGSLRNVYSLDEGNKFEVDSDALIYNICKNGIKDVYSKLDGSACIVWHDSRDGTLNMIRNAERPMFYAFANDGKALLWASEYFMLKAALTRNALKHTDVIDLPVHTHVSFKLNHTYNHPTPVECPTETPLSHYVPSVIHQVKTLNRGTYSNIMSRKEKKTYSAGSSSSVLKENNYNYDTPVEFILYEELENGNLLGSTIDSVGMEIVVHCTDAKVGNELLAFNGYFSAKLTGYYGKSPTYPKGALSTSHNNVIKKVWCADTDLPTCDVETFNKLIEENSCAVIKDHRGNVLTEKEFNERYHYCSWCSDSLDVNDMRSAVIISHTEAVCGYCAKTDDVKEILSSYAA